jgi:uncharacterized membrane protein YoaK (UPF0700 family)
MAGVLAFAAGCVDASGYLTLFHLFTAHMSGNSAALGAYLGQGDWRAALHRAFPIPVFILGVALGAAIVETGVRRGYRSSFSLALACEAALLGAFALFGGRLFPPATAPPVAWEFYGLAALLPLAMGVQNATLRRVGGQRIRTTYVTGMLTDLAETAVEALYASRRPGAGGVPGESSWCRVGLLAAIWGAFIAGAVAGGLAVLYWRQWALLLPLALLAGAIGVDLVRPVELRPQRGKSEAPE